MSFGHLFEFMDLPWLPSSLRLTLREILECGNAKPFRPYYQWVSDEVLRYAQQHGIEYVVELGAGTAPLTRHMSKDARSQGLRLVVCDGNPDRSAYLDLEKGYPGQVEAVLEAMNFAEPRKWKPRTLLVLSATLHHVPSAERTEVIRTLTESADLVMVFEPLRKTALSILFVLLSLTPAILLPILFLRRSGSLRRLLWCWLIPLAPPMFLWDGWISCIRQWSEREWRTKLNEVAGRAANATIRHSHFCQEVAW